MGGGEALNGRQDYIANKNATFNAPPRPRGGDAERRPRRHLPVPEGGAFFLYSLDRGCIGKTDPGATKIDNDETFATHVVEEKGVGVVFGGASSVSSPLLFRVSYATADEGVERSALHPDTGFSAESR